MPIPAFTTDGLLPEGIYDCTLDEIRERLAAPFSEPIGGASCLNGWRSCIRVTQASGLVIAVIVDGSFVTDKDAPNDIDLIIVTVRPVRFPPVLHPIEYNSLSKHYIRRTFGFDMLLAEVGRLDVTEHVAVLCSSPRTT